MEEGKHQRKIFFKVFSSHGKLLFQKTALPYRVAYVHCSTIDDNRNIHEPISQWNGNCVNHGMAMPGLVKPTVPANDISLPASAWSCFFKIVGQTASGFCAAVSL
ncbi:hypothetical protein V9K67_26800 [Paraflavisolibacter sp. H34]|uniref:hypothetical protein n=1 Tax=Huijunlia imazamoxiresistens TaxID=3127457 RepID=UPI0030193EB0